MIYKAEHGLRTLQKYSLTPKKASPHILRQNRPTSWRFNNISFLGALKNTFFVAENTTLIIGYNLP